MLKRLLRSRLPKKFVDLCRDRCGSMYVLTAFAMPIIVGFGGMGLDVAMWYAEKRTTQSIADAAAVAATYEKMNGGDLTAMTSAAQDEAVRNGYQAAPANALEVALSTMPAPSATSAPVVDVRVRREVPVYMLGWFLSGNPHVAAIATGGLRNIGTNCVIALNETAARAVEFSGSTSANVGCGVTSNSNSSEALYIGGSATLTANPAQANGDIVISGGGTLTSALPMMPFSPRVPDPFGNRSYPPVSGACDSTGLVVSGTQTIGPAVSGGSYRICGDLTVLPTGDLTLQPGTYYVEGDITFQGTVTGTDVTLVLTGATPSDVGTIDVNAGAVVNLTAPSAPGPFQGIVVYQDKIADHSGTNKLNGGADMIFNGALYFPSKTTEFAGGAGTGTGCTMLVADQVKFVGDSYIENDPTTCGAVGLSDSTSPAQQQVVLMQ